MSERWWVKYYLTWLLVSLLFMVCRDGIHSLATLIFFIFFFFRNNIHTCDSTYRCARKYVQSPGVRTSKITCPQNILYNIAFINIFIFCNFHSLM